MLLQSLLPEVVGLSIVVSDTASSKPASQQSYVAVVVGTAEVLTGGTSGNLTSSIRFFQMICPHIQSRPIRAILHGILAQCPEHCSFSHRLSHRTQVGEHCSFSHSTLPQKTKRNPQVPTRTHMCQRTRFTCLMKSDEVLVRYTIAEGSAR